MSNVKDRILQLAENQGVRKEKFFSDLGLSYANFKGKSKGSAPSTDILEKILTIYPTVNVNWLLLGKGPMYINETSNVSADVDYKYKYYEILEKYTLALEEIKLLQSSRTKSTTASIKHTHKQS